MEYSKEEMGEAVSPMGQCFNSSTLCIHVLAFMEFEVPIHDLQLSSLAKDILLPLPRFSSIMVTNEKGVKRWKQVEVKLEEHLIHPIFPDGMSVDSYDQCFSDYVSRISMEPPQQDKPLWQIHVFKYPTSNAAGTLIFKLHHALGDGYTLMGVLLSCLQRNDDPSIPLSFPSRKPAKPELAKRCFLGRLPGAFSWFCGSISDFGCSLLKNTLLEDDKTPIRSGQEGREFRPIALSHIVLSIELVREIKSKLGVTTNDVITGIIFYGLRLYMQDMDYKSRAANSTALVMLNMRNVAGYESVKDMLKRDAKVPWGNRVSFLHISIPKLKKAQISNPLEFIWTAHNIIKRKRYSFAVVLTGMLLQMNYKFRGHEAVAKQVLSTLRKSSVALSSLIGPLEQMALAGHPIKGLCFCLAGGPESLGISILSYMGVLRVTLKTEKGFIDEHKLKSCTKGAFDIMLKAVRDIPNKNKS